MIFCAHTQEELGLVERHALLFEAKTYSPGADMYAMPVEDARQAFLVRTLILRQLLVFITRENASLAPLARLTRKMVPITGRASSFLVFLEFSKTK